MKIIGVPFATLVRMYNDASTLVRNENKIVKAPGEGDNLPRYVANNVSNLPPYQVSQKRVADIDNRLSDFLKTYKMKNEGKRD